MITTSEQPEPDETQADTVHGYAGPLEPPPASDPDYEPDKTAARVISIVASICGAPADAITPETSLKTIQVDEHWTIELDSLDRLELGMHIEDDFALEIPDQDVQAWATVGDVAAYLDRRRQQQERP